MNVLMTVIQSYVAVVMEVVVVMVVMEMMEGVMA